MRKQTICLLLASTCLLRVTVCGVTVAKEPPYRSARLHGGQPDLQGTWQSTNLTPLERSVDFTTLVITAAQAAKLEERINAPLEDRNTPTEPTEYFDIRSVERVRGELRSSLLIDPADGKLPSNDLYRRTLAEIRTGHEHPQGPEQRPSMERCLPTRSAIPPTISMASNGLRQIIQTSSFVVMHAEAVSDARIIRLNSQHGPAIPSWLGDSIGWWEGDTLVVETVHFLPRYPGRGSTDTAFLLSGDATVLERFTRVSRDEILYEFSVNDPVYYTRPWRGESHLLLTDDRILEYACHEGNYSLPSILQAARQRDAASQAH